MTPRPTPYTPTGILHEHEEEIAGKTITLVKPSHRKIELVWRNIILFVIFHTLALVGFYLLFAKAQNYTRILTGLTFFFTTFGLTAGAHRLYSHRAYKATFPLRLLLLVLNTMTFQNSFIEWARDHRLHHKYTETDADPHNALRGFFFAHMGWLLCRKHPEVIAKGRTIDLSDLYAEPMVAFQHRHYLKLMFIACFFIPTFIPMYFWNETFLVALCANMARYVVQLHFTWTINSLAHLTDAYKPYDKNINPSEQKLVAFLSFGEGWHNYHHIFPWDYKTSEHGTYGANFTTAFLDFFSYIGWAYDMKTVSDEMIRRRVLRTGDGSHPVHK